MNDLASRLAGSWSLVSWRRVSGDGTERAPFGEAAQGSLFYVAGADGAGWLGRMGAQLSVSGRPQLQASPTSSERLREKSAAFDTYLAYSGRWRLDGNRVIHAVEMSLYPAWTGTELVRVVSFVGEELVLSAMPEPGSSARAVQHLRWRRNT